MTWLWLLLAAIGTHAMLPVGSPLARSSGSAFSAATADVSLGPQRRQVAGQAEFGQDLLANRGSGSSGGSDVPLLPLAAVFSPPLPVEPRASAPLPDDPFVESSATSAFRARAPPSA